MSDFKFIDLLRARIGEKVHVKLKARDYATILTDVVGDTAIFNLGKTMQFVHYTQVSFYCHEKDAKKVIKAARKCRSKRGK